MNTSSKDLYTLLKIKPDSSDTDIKSAFLKKSKELHPDKNKNSTTDQIQEIIEAKNILLDPELRKLYDLKGYDLIKSHLHSTSKFKSENQKAANRDIPCSSYENVFVDYDCSLKDMYLGTERTIEYQINTFCQKCVNSKLDSGNKCEKCNGTGKYNEKVCSDCNGNRQIYCLECKDKKYYKKTLQKTIQIFNADDGETIHEKGFGNELSSKRTNLVVVVNIFKDNHYKKFKNDILMKMEINLFEALFGFERVIKYIDDHDYCIFIENDVISPGDYRVVKGLGLRCKESFLRGDLVILFDVKMPSELPESKVQSMLSYMIPKTLNSTFDADASIVEMHPI